MLRSLYKIFFIGILLSLFPSWGRADPLPNITAQAWLIADVNGNILQGSNTTDVRSIASITKLMTVMVVIDAQQDLNEVVTKKLFNKNLTRMDLIDLAIVKSDNEASKILCDKYPGGYKSCVQAMNDKARGLQMYNTSFTDPTGRMHDNVSTAQDLIKLVIASSSYQVIVDASKKDHLSYSTGKRNSLVFNNTNNLVGKGYDFIVTKTGFINKAGGCIVFMIDTVRGVRTVIVLGSKNTRTRIPEAFLLSTLY
jgi:D-alanyl-D-alanine endopeptidase (penicillin-binding protein 7)